MAKPALRVLTGNGEVLEPADLESENRALRTALTRAENVIRGLRLDKAAERKRYANRALIEEVFSDWQAKTRHQRSKLTDDRFDAIQALVEQGYTLEHFQLVNTALAAYPFERYGKRYATGAPADRKDDLEYTCSKGRRFELMANLGHELAKTAGAKDAAQVDCGDNEIGAAPRQRPAPRHQETRS